MVKFGSITESKENPFRFKAIVGELNSRVDIIASPSPYVFCLPETGDPFSYMESEATEKRLIAPLYEAGLSATMEDPATGVMTTYFDSQATPSNLELMAQGDCYIGKHGRAYFSRHAFMHSESYRSRLFLDNLGTAELTAYNWVISSEDGHAKISSASSTAGAVFGDTITMQRTGVTGDSAILSLDALGAASLSVGVTGANAVGIFSMAANGDASLSCGATGTVAADPLAYIRIANKAGSVGTNISLFSESFSGKFDGAATLEIGGPLTITCAQAVSITGDSVTINANAAELAFKSALDALKAQLDNFIESDFARHKHATAGSGAPSAPMEAVPTPRPLGSTGTTKTKAG